MKLPLAVACLIFPIACLADAGLPCKQIEYAQLKDSSRVELQDMYCTAVRRDKFNSDEVAALQGGMSQRIDAGEDVSQSLGIAREYTEAKKSCLAAADAAWRMLTKKYRIKQPSCK